MLFHTCGPPVWLRASLEYATTSNTTPHTLDFGGLLFNKWEEKSKYQVIDDLLWGEVHLGQLPFFIFFGKGYLHFLSLHNCTCVRALPQWRDANDGTQSTLTYLISVPLPL